LPGLPRPSSSISAWFQTKSDAELPVLDSAQPAIITFTSGTTGDPKGVVHTLSTISANLDNFGELFNVQPGELIYSEPMTVGIVALAHGANWCIPEKHTPAPGKIDLLFGVPTEILSFLEKTKNRNIVVKAAATGAAPVLPSLVRAIDAAFGADCRIVNVYGMTEMLPVAVCDARLKANDLEGDLLGTPIGDTCVKIAEDGEILVQGSGLMIHYFGREPQQWHPTGDLGFVNDEGMIVMLGRKKNMLIRGNKNIYPSLYEPGLTTIEGVADAVISGSPDEFGDDRVVLFIVVEPGFDATVVLERVKSRQREFIDTDALPDRIELLASVPTSGRANKRDMPAIAAIAKAVFEGARV
jgi:long-subunit acyl-CoA synthetase (AMP-forming)